MVGTCKQCETGECALHKFPFGGEEHKRAMSTSPACSIADDRSYLHYRVEQGCDTCVREYGKSHHCRYCVWNRNKMKNNWRPRPSLGRQ